MSKGKSLRAWDSGKKIRCGEESWKGGEEGGALLLQEIRSDPSERRSALLSRAHARPRLTVRRASMQGGARRNRGRVSSAFSAWGRRSEVRVAPPTSRAGRGIAKLGEGTGRSTVKLIKVASRPFERGEPSARAKRLWSGTRQTSERRLVVACERYQSQLDYACPGPSTMSPAPFSVVFVGAGEVRRARKRERDEVRFSRC